MIIQGTIIKMFDTRSFGFIKNLLGAQYFFHRDDCQCDWDELEIGTKVEFEPVDTRKGLRAKSVTILGEEPS